MKRMQAVVAIFALVGLPNVAAAHPGHGPEAHGWLHFFTEPGHLPFAVGLACLVSVAAFYGLKRIKTRHITMV